MSADTKTYLYLDPSKLLSRAWSMWDPSIGLGTVTHQNIGYLWPMGPFYWLLDTLGRARLGRPAPVVGHDHLRGGRGVVVPAAHAGLAAGPASSRPRSPTP